MRRWGSLWLQLAGLWSLAVVQPLFELLDDSGDFLVARGNAWPDILAATLILVVAPPTGMVAVEYAAERLGGYGRQAHAALVGLIAAALAIQFLKEHFDPASRAITLAGLVTGLVVALAWLRTRFVPMFLLVLSAAALVVPVWFLGFSSVASTAWPHSEPVVAGNTRTVPVVFLVIDEMSIASIMDADGRIDRKLFPNFAELADRTTWFRDATTVADGTINAVPAILTGHLIPEDDRLPDARSYPPSIFARLGPSWHYEVGPEPATNMCVEDYCPATKDAWPERTRQLLRDLAKIMKDRLKPGPEPTSFLAVPETVARRKETFRSWVAGIRGGRTLNLLHIEMPHSPYQYDAKGRRYSTEDTLPGLTNDVWADDPEAVRQGFHRYLIQSEFTDRLVGELIDRLDQTGLWDKALILVTADHGVAFVPGRSRRSGVPETAGQIAGMPMFFKAPGQSKGRVDDTAVRNIDLLPTVGDYLGANWKLPGFSLRHPHGRTDVDMMVRFNQPVKMPLASYTALRDKAIKDLAAMR